MKFTERNTLNDLKSLPDWAKSIEMSAKTDPNFIEDFLENFKESIKSSNKKPLKESEEDFESDVVTNFEKKVEAYEDYIEKDFYNESCNDGDTLSKVYNSIDELKYDFADYEDACEDKQRAADYCERMYNVIDALKDFAERGDEE